MSSWGVRIGEGLLIGLGASIMFFGIQKARDAVEVMEGYSNRFEKQEKINTDITEKSITQANKLSAVNSLVEKELSKVNATLDKLATKLEEIENSSASTSGSSIDPVFWTQLKSNQKNQIKVPDSLFWYAPALGTTAEPPQEPKPEELEVYNITPQEWGNPQGNLWWLNPEEVTSWEELSNVITEQSKIKVK